MLRKLFKIFKWTLGIILGLMLLISAVLIIFKDDIKSYAIKEINNNLNKELHVSYIDVSFWRTFPNFSLDFDDVLIHDKFDTLQRIDTALYAKKVALKFNPLDFLSSDYTVRSIHVTDAQVNLKVDKQNRVNYDFLKKSEKSAEKSFEFVLEEILVENTFFSYSNLITKQNHRANFDLLTLEGELSKDVFTLHANSNFTIETIKSDAVTLIKKKQASCDIDIAINSTESSFEISRADLKVQNLPFDLKGKVSKDSINFNINASNLSLQDVANNFSVQQLNQVKQLNGTGNVGFNLAIKGKNDKSESAKISADFSISEGSLKSNNFVLTQINSRGNYSNFSGKNILTISTIDFLSSGSKFKGKLSVTDFDKPKFVGNANGSLNLNAIHELFGPFGLKQLTGNINLNSSFNIRMNNPVFNPKDLTITSLKGNIILQNISTTLINDTRNFKNISGEITVRNQNAIFKDIRLNLGSSDLAINGDFSNIASYFKGDGTLNINTAIKSSVINVNNFSSTKGASTAKTWVLPTRIKGKVKVNAEVIKYGGHTYSSISSHLKVLDRSLQFYKLSGTNAGATVNGKILIKEDNPSVLTLSTDLASNNIRFNSLFKEWNNFDQTMIASTNIEGIAKVKLKFSAPFDLVTGVVKEKIASTINIDIENGALRNVSTFKEITNSLRAYGGKLVIAKKKIDAFESKLLNLEFKRMQNELVIKNGVLYIPEMTIESNALDVTLSGEHNFNNAIDYHFDFRFRDLKGASRNTEFGEIVDDGTGFRIYLRMFGVLDNPSFAWDKDAKKKDKEIERQEAIKDAKSILKSGFSLKKNDTTPGYTPPPKLEEEIILDFDKDTLSKPETDFDKKKKDSKWMKAFEKMKQENSEENEEEFIIGG